MIRTLVAAARPTVRAGLAAVLRTGGIEVAGEAAGASHVLALAASLAPAAMLIELETADEELGGVVASLALDSPETGVVLLCDADREWIANMLRNGVRGVLPRDAESAEIVAAVTAAAQGLLVLPVALARDLLPLEAPAPVTPSPAQGGASVESLTPRELEVLRHISEGLGNKGIAQRLHISEHTVKFHVAAAMAKLGSASRTEAVATAARRGLIML